MQGESHDTDKSVASTAWIDSIQQQVKAFYGEIDRAGNKILELTENWDGEGARAYSKAIWERVAEFVKGLAFRVWNLTCKIISIPIISPGPDGSIDIHWKTPEFDLLINIPESTNEAATFAVDDYGKSTANGTFITRKLHPMLVSWMVEFV